MVKITYIYSVVVLADGNHVLSGGREGKIRRWRIEDGKEVGTAMDARGPVFSIAVLRNGKVIVSGTENGLATVWNVESHSKVAEFKGHSGWVTVTLQLGWVLLTSRQTERKS